MLINTSHMQRWIKPSKTGPQAQKFKNPTKVKPRLKPKTRAQDLLRPARKIKIEFKVEKVEPKSYQKLKPT